MTSTSERTLDAIRGATGSVAPPRSNGELVFDAPWQGRVFAAAIAVVDHVGLQWDDFRTRLIAEIECEPGRPYYESWVAALERLVAEHDLVDGEELKSRLSSSG